MQQAHHEKEGTDPTAFLTDHTEMLMFFFTIF